MNRKLTFIILFVIANTIAVFALQPDTLKIHQINTLPLFDGRAIDTVWASTTWIDIDQSWIPIDEKLSSTDFTGRFKALWSATSQLLFFVVEITDDFFRDGYVYAMKDGSYANYDIFEVFIDPNRSGGLHVFDGKCDDATHKRCWGINAEDAFTYHINVNALADGETTFLKSVEDISGKSWRTKYIRNYEAHLPQFAFRKTGNTYTYEFSLKVYNHNYNPKLPLETDRDTLFVNKIMGMSVAYCDSDTKNGKAKRDNFIGSTKPDINALDKQGGFNQAWMNASYYGVVKLILE